MKRNHLLMIMIAVTIASYMLTGWLSEVFFGVDLPLIGQVGVEPLSGITEFGVLIGGSSVIIIYLILGRKTK